MKDKLLNIIKAHTPDEPIVSARLEERLGITGTQVRAFIKELRRVDKHICSSSAGYYYSDDVKHVTATIENLEKRAHSMLKTAASMRRTFKVTSQLEIKF